MLSLIGVVMGVASMVMSVRFLRLARATRPEIVECVERLELSCLVLEVAYADAVAAGLEVVKDDIETALIPMRGDLASARRLLRANQRVIWLQLVGLWLVLPLVISANLILFLL